MPTPWRRSHGPDHVRSREGTGNKTATSRSTLLLPGIGTRTPSKPGRDNAASPPSPAHLPGPGPARPGPQPQTPTYCQPLQALAMLRWDGVPTREGRHVRGAVARQPHLRVARETWLVCRASDGSCGQGCAARGQRRGAVSGGIHTEGGGEVGRLRTGTWWVVTELSGRRSGDIPH